MLCDTFNVLTIRIYTNNFLSLAGEDLGISRRESAIKPELKQNQPQPPILSILENTKKVQKAPSLGCS